MISEKVFENHERGISRIGKRKYELELVLECSII